VEVSLRASDEADPLGGGNHVPRAGEEGAKRAKMEKISQRRGSRVGMIFGYACMHPCTRRVYAMGEWFANLKTAAGLTSKSLLHAIWAVLQSPFHLPDVDAFNRTDLCELTVRTSRKAAAMG